MNTDRKQPGSLPPSEKAEGSPATWQALDKRSGWWRELPAWLLSLVFHLTILLTMATFITVAPRGANLEPARGGGIVLAQDVGGSSEDYGADGQSTSPSTQPSQQETSANDALPGGEQVPIDLAGALPAATNPTDGSGLGDGLPSAGGMAGGANPGRGSVGGNPAHTQVFGAQGTGNKFVYVFDRSASTDGYQGRPLAAEKRELIASLNDLDDIHQFQIVFYNEQSTVFNPDAPQPPKMLFGEASTKRLAQNFVRGIIAAGGTRHSAALRLALNMKPDVIFFLTDAGDPVMTASEMEEVRQRNMRTGATINVIEFGSGPNPGGENFLVRLARQNSGQYVYVDVTRLPPAGMEPE